MRVIVTISPNKVFDRKSQKSDIKPAGLPSIIKIRVNRGNKRFTGCPVSLHIISERVMR